MLDGEGASVIEEAKAGFTCPAGDSAGLANNALRMAAMSARDRLAMGSHGAAYAKREFDRDVLVSRLEELLADLPRAPRANVET
jgi:colanic acid biosynthesis glycosyl transferase WcaI